MIYNEDLIQVKKFIPREEWILVDSITFVSIDYTEKSNFYWLGGEYYLLHWEREDYAYVSIREFYSLYTSKATYIKALKDIKTSYKWSEGILLWP